MTAGRSYLYVPGDRPERFGRAETSGADAVIFDLEDAVALAHKDAARAAVLEWLGERARDPAGADLGDGAVARWVRINADERGLDDARVLASLRPHVGLLVPKATTAGLARLAEVTAARPLIPLIESAAALGELDAIAGHPTVVALAMGEVDLAADLGFLAPVEDATWWPFRARVIAAAAAAGCGRPIGPVETRLDDPAALRASTQRLRRLGFGARQAIHPNQVEVINAAFTPSADEVAAALRLIELADGAHGGVCVDDDGRMIDEAVLRSARLVLDAASRAEDR